MKALKNNRGIAILIALSIVTLAVTAALEFNREARMTVATTATARDNLTLSYMALSGVHAAMAMLVKDKRAQGRDIDSVQEDWANPEKIAEVLEPFTFDEGSVTFKITDELGKLQINALVEYPEGRVANEAQARLWQKIFESIGNKDEAVFEDFEPGQIVDSLKDWLDRGDGDSSEFNGAETDYYEGLEPPYKCKNGPISHLSELLLIKGFIPELYYGFEDLPGLKDLVTVYGAEAKGDEFTFEGKVNINTAPLAVIAALIPSENIEYAQAIVDYRDEKSGDDYVNDITSSNWYRNVIGVPQDLAIDSNVIRYDSDYYRIEATATLHKRKFTQVAVVHRGKEKSGKPFCKILHLETK